MIGFWTDDKVEHLCRLWADGDSASVIGIALGATRSAILGKVHRLGLSSRLPFLRSDVRPVYRSRERKPRIEPAPTSPKFLVVVSPLTGQYLHSSRKRAAEPEQTKTQLRAMLMQAVLNTAGMK